MVVPPFAGVRPGRGTHTQLGRKPVVGEPVVTVTPRDTVVPPPPAAPAPATPRSGWILPPQLGDGRLWVSPRPALPVEVADAIYGEHPAQDSMLVRRLRAMVDSLNLVIDAVQRAHQLPSWTTKGDNGKPMWGIDQGGIYVAGVKIPTAGLALLGSLLPPGNYDESVRQRHLADMRDDIMRAAARAQNFDDFRRYVRELRARKQAERDAERRQSGDTSSVQP